MNVSYLYFQEITAKNQNILEKSVSPSTLVDHLIRDISIKETNGKDNEMPKKRATKKPRRDTGNEFSQIFQTLF